eukprot:jgi/Phyca11/14581/fgenesh1_pg.PHYCAscaffold_8_\
MGLALAMELALAMGLVLAMELALAMGLALAMELVQVCQPNLEPISSSDRSCQRLFQISTGGRQRINFTAQSLEILGSSRYPQQCRSQLISQVADRRVQIGHDVAVLLLDALKLIFEVRDPNPIALMTSQRANDVIELLPGFT